jgi:hypothetical protein
MGDFRRAFESYPPLQMGATRQVNANELLNLKRVLDLPVAGAELAALKGAKITKWAEKNLARVVEYLDASLTAMQRDRGASLLREWSRGKKNYPWGLFRATPRGNSARIDQPYYLYYIDENIVQFVDEQIREAENTVREEAGIPRVGEGWVSETTLYYEIKNAFSDLQVLHHAQPPWMGRQHLDVYIPELQVALEYHGLQHDQPVEYFGGEEQFRQTQERDARKLRLCLENGVILIYVREGYDLNSIVSEILSVKPP